MAFIVLSVVGCIDYLAYGSIFRREVFLFVAKEEKKMSFLIPAKKTKVFAGRWCVALRQFSQIFVSD
jgi:hypothetical protein